MRQRLHPEQKFSQNENHPSHGWLQKKSIHQDSETDDEMDTPGVYKGPGLSRNLEGSAKIPFTDYSHLKPDPSDFIRESIQQRFSTPPIQAKNSQEETNNNSEQETEIVQQKRENGESIEAQKQISPNRTGLPDRLKTGVENLSGYSLDDVRVHYNSPKPAQLQAHAYTQGTEIHVAPGQEQHLPHETWHVVQQMQGRVKPTMQMKRVQINDDQGLEREADVMGRKAKNRLMANRKKEGVRKAERKRGQKKKVVQKQEVIQLKDWYSYGAANKVPHVHCYGKKNAYDCHLKILIDGKVKRINIVQGGELRDTAHDALEAAQQYGNGLDDVIQGIIDEYE
ncbi:MAG: DUF4157 domain-containing protein [Crocosphaera sp.]|nr:DUF4157 domain-containing protein [Crocosphaera sp.]